MSFFKPSRLGERSRSLGGVPAPRARRCGVHLDAGHASVPLAEVAGPSQGNEYQVDPDTGDVTLTVLTDILGHVEVVAVGPVDSPLPVTGPCSRCGSPTTVYGPNGSPLCDPCRDRTATTGKDAEPI
jgi:hypothetical protein